MGQLRANSGANEQAMSDFRIAEGFLAQGVALAPSLRLSRNLEVRLQTTLGRLLFRQHKPADARLAAKRAADVARALVDEDPSYSYDLACALALQAELDPAAPGPPAAAMVALRNAVNAGFDNVFKLNNDESLAPIRSRGDFHSVVEIAAKNAIAAAGSGDGPKP